MTSPVEIAQEYFDMGHEAGHAGADPEYDIPAYIAGFDAGVEDRRDEIAEGDPDAYDRERESTGI